MDIQEIRNKLMDKGLKVTPQRMAVLEAINKLHNHPAADQIIEYIRQNNPNIATGTVYNVLETLTERKIIDKVKTDRDVMRYDADTRKHHHLYCMGSNTIDDYYDEKLTKMLRNYFKKNKVPGFNIDDVQLHLIGRYEDSEKCR
jgi:Fur family peroxide stress response transcriptional regulator